MAPLFGKAMSKFFKEKIEKHWSDVHEENSSQVDKLQKKKDAYGSNSSLINWRKVEKENADQEINLIEMGHEEFEQWCKEEGKASIKYSYKKNKSQIFTAPRSELPKFLLDPRVAVRETEKMGNGCFALEKIEKHTLIESCPIILIHQEFFTHINALYESNNVLSEYPFQWKDAMMAFALGYGGVYNHKAIPNVKWRPNFDYKTLEYITTRDIEEGEELFIRYLPPYKLSDLWFVDEESLEIGRAWEESHSSMGHPNSWDEMNPLLRNRRSSATPPWVKK